MNYIKLLIINVMFKNDSETTTLYSIYRDAENESKMDSLQECDERWVYYSIYNSNDKFHQLFAPR